MTLPLGPRKVARCCSVLTTTAVTVLLLLLVLPFRPAEAQIYNPVCTGAEILLTIGGYRGVTCRCRPAWDFGRGGPGYRAGCQVYGGSKNNGVYLEAFARGVVTAEFCKIPRTTIPVVGYLSRTCTKYIACNALLTLVLDDNHQVDICACSRITGGHVCKSCTVLSSGKTVKPFDDVKISVDCNRLNSGSSDNSSALNASLSSDNDDASLTPDEAELLNGILYYFLNTTKTNTTSP